MFLKVSLGGGLSYTIISVTVPIRALNVNLFIDDATKKPEDANYSVCVLTRCVVNKERGGKKITKIVTLKEPGEPLVVSIPISQVESLDSFFILYYS